MKIKSLILTFMLGAMTLNAQENKVTIIEYNPAPGQFINTLPSSKDATTAEEMAARAQKNIDRNSMVCLGGFGGYITAKFEYPVRNIDGEYDILVLGNSFETSAEPGVIMVSKDVNKNGIADDKWYEIAGSEYNRSTKNYEITYYKPSEENDLAEGEVAEYIKWTDNQGNSGWLPKNNFHKQSYYPTWIKSDKITFSGTLVPDNAKDVNKDGSYYELPPYEWGYADNHANKNTEGCSIKLEWAVNDQGRKVNLNSIDFIKIYTGVHGVHGNIGESSTEITAIKGLHDKLEEPKEPVVSDTINMKGITLDLDDVISYSDIAFNDLDIWSETKNDSDAFRTFGNEWFKFSHLNSENDYDGTSWEGFTVSKNRDTSTEYEQFAPNHQWGCMAGHGVDGEDTPFILAYYSDYFEKSAEGKKHSCEIKFQESGDPVIVGGTYICNTPYTTKGITEGIFVARKFEQGDYCTVTAHGLDSEGNDNGKSVTYYMADYRDEDSTKWTINNSWEWMDLTGLGAVNGVYFTMESTDSDPVWGPNTPLYFAIDKMKYYVRTADTAIENVEKENNISIYPNPCRGTLYIECQTNESITIYNIQGQALLTAAAESSSIDVSHLNRGIYIVKCGNKTEKLIIE